MTAMQEFGLGRPTALSQASTLGRSEVINLGMEVLITPKQEEKIVLRYIMVQ